MQGTLQHVSRASRAAAAAGADPELLAQFSQTGAALGDGAADIAFGDGIADANVHDGSGLFGKDQLALPGAPQAVGFALMGDLDFVAAAQ